MADAPHLIVMCVAGDVSSVSPAISCGTIGGVPYSAVVVEGHALSPEQYQSVVGVAAPFDAMRGAELFAYGFGVVVGCWVIAHTAAVVVRAVRDF